MRKPAVDMRYLSITHSHCFETRSVSVSGVHASDYTVWPVASRVVSFSATNSGATQAGKTCPGLMWLLDTQTRVHILVQQTSYPLKPLFSPSSILIITHFTYFPLISKFTTHRVKFSFLDHRWLSSLKAFNAFRYKISRFLLVWKWKTQMR